MSSERFDGKVAFITGAAQGIGETFARTLAGRGAAIAIADLKEVQAKEVAESIEKEGGQAVALACDVTDESQVGAAVARTRERFGGVDILVNNAAMHLMEYNRPCCELPLENWRLMLDVNVVGIVNCAKACRASMKERGGGVIVNMSSIAGSVATSPYGVSKLAVNGLTVALAKELAPDGTRVYGIAPGIVDSQAAMDDVPKEIVEQYIQQHQLIKRQGRMTDLANALLFFCSDQASFITGETLLVSGGHPLRI